MTRKVYKSAMGKSVDLGALLLQNEHVRAVGNMNVNARGDRLDNNNQVIETKPRQIQRQTARTTVATAVPVHTSTGKAKRSRQTQQEFAPSDEVVEDQPLQEFDSIIPVTQPEPVADVPAAGGGLAAAIARSKIVKQEKEKTLRELQQSIPGVRKI